MALNPWGSIGSPAEQTAALLRSRGIHASYDDESGAHRYFRGGGDDEGVGRRVFGSPWGEDGAPNFTTVDIGGRAFSRLGGDPNTDFASRMAYEPFSQNVKYDPTYGWVLPQELMYSPEAGYFYTGGGSSIFDDPFVKWATDGKHGGYQEIAGNAPVVAAAALAGAGAAGLAGYGPLAAGAGTTAGATGLGATELSALAEGAGLGATTPAASGFITPAGAGLGAETAGFAGSVGSPLATGAGALPAWAETAGAAGGASAGIGGAGTGLMAGAAPTAGAAASGTALSRIIDGTASNADWLSVLGTAGATGLGMFAANQQSNSLERLAEQTRAERAPFLNQATGWLNNPDSYWQGPGQASLDANLRRLSASHGNPISSPTALGIASQAGLQDWRNAWSTAGNLGLGGQDIRAQLGGGAAQADANMLSIGGRGLSEILNPPRKELSLADFALLIGGQRV